jgi:UDP-GlcNAc:undecaprenyl-phosphate/decaprenyl-phosphate GlcNAc-1-phosphate transferase
MEFFLEKINIENYGFFILVISFIICYLMIPKLIGVSRYKKLMDNPNSRSSHVNNTPTLGGIAFYISLILCLFIIQWLGFDVGNISFNIMASVTILFIAGLKDDLVVISPGAKIISQLIAVTFILLNPEIYIINLHGFLGLTEIPFAFTIIFSYLLVLSIINAFNLIDGIDGLASMLGIVIFSVFSLVFYNLQLYYYFLLSLVSIGFLIAFLRYNLSLKNKIFMGDTGSMIVGFLIGIMTLRFLALNTVQLQEIYIQPANIILLVLSVLFILFMDTLRVITVRLINKKGIFLPDRNHIHHILVNLGWSHLKASILITIFNVFVMGLFFMLNIFLETKSLGVIFVFITLVTMYILFYLNTNYIALKQKNKIVPTFAKKNKVRIKNIPIFRMFF